MPRLLALLLLLPSLCFAGDWAREDTYRQSALTVLLIADWAQTKWVVHHASQTVDMSNAYSPNNYKTYEGAYETNPLLGRHPSAQRVNFYFATTIAVHAGISYFLPSGWREGWQYVWIGVEANQVNRNRAIGIKMNF
jgi:hypothetical protein